MTTSTSCHQKKLALINDLSGYGRCSITVCLPVISHLRLQCCPVPTAILSNHTGFKNYFFEDYTDRMQTYINEWKKLELSFDGILTGFLGSKEQIEIVMNFIREFRTEETVVIVDPIMGDDGTAYATYTSEMCGEMRKLAAMADILTPNLTEACILTDTPYRADGWHLKELTAIAKQLSGTTNRSIVITGIRQGDFIANLIYDKAGVRIRRCHKVGEERPGTGDIFSSIIAADAVNGVEFSRSVHRASLFIKQCLEKSTELHVPRLNGVCFEELLYKLSIT